MILFTVTVFVVLGYVFQLFCFICLLNFCGDICCVENIEVFLDACQEEVSILIVERGCMIVGLSEEVFNFKH
jgi:hypothetical protein